MSHRLGSVLTLGAPIDFGPDSGPPTSPNTWAITFPVDPLAKFVMLHFVGTALAASDRVEIDLGYDVDVYTTAWGADYWSRPIRGDVPVTIRYVRSGAGGGHARLDKYGRGEAVQNGGATNANADVFLIASPYADHSPAAQYSGGKFPPGSASTWENVDCLPAGVMRDTARSVGMYIDVDGDHLSSCSATLIAPDLIVTAGHCVTTDEQARTGSITFDYQADCFGNRPFGYSPKFHKLKRVVKAKFVVDVIDYCVIQVVTPAAGLGLAPIPLRPDQPPLDEPLFIIHHPRGATKRVSRHPIDSECVVRPGTSAARVYFRCDIDNGSSGSSIFDSSGRIVANLSQWEWGTSAQAIAQDVATAPPPARDLDVVLVLDRSGSMSLPGFGTTDSKLTQAKQAAALFVSLLRTDKTHRAGLATFSGTASADFALAPVSVPATKSSLIGPPPPGLIGGIAAGGSTTIGGGLQTGASLFPPPGPSTNTRAMLLLTDGLQNTLPSIETGESSLGATLLNVIGFGTEASLDGARLTRLARDHGGIYWRAEEGLSLKKYFALAFGNIFDFGVSFDPRFFLPAGVMAGTAIDTNVCGETMLTVVLGWDNPGASLLVSVRSPAGATITATSPGVVAATGDTWAHLRIALPFAGDRDGTWTVRALRPGGGGEFPPPTPATNYFLMTLVDGGPVLYPLVAPIAYTGDRLNPRVALSPPAGAQLQASVTVEIESPIDGTGNLLMNAGLGAAGTLDGDAIDPRTRRLIALEQAKGGALISTLQRVVPLFDDGAHDDGAMEEDGVFGNPLDELTTVEGNYTFHAVASYGHDCIAQRETTWSVYVAIGIDPGKTTVTAEPGATLPDGRHRVLVRFTPRDRYGNHLGPGRAGSFEVGDAPGCALDGVVVDRGDGSYEQTVLCEPDTDRPAGITVTQPGRTPIVVAEPQPELFSYCVTFHCGEQQGGDCECAPLRPGVYATEINLHNYHDAEVAVKKFVIPVVSAGAVTGREPRVVTVRAADKIVLPPHTATMDDCCRLAELLGGPAHASALTSGILEIVSRKPLAVTAVHTMRDPVSGAVSMDVEQIEGTRHGP